MATPRVAGLRPIQVRRARRRRFDTDTPHDIIGLLAMTIVFLALLLGYTLVTAGATVAVVGVVILTPLLIVGLTRRAARERRARRAPERRA